MKNKFNLKDWAIMGLTSLPLVFTLALAFKSCDERGPREINTQREQELQQHRDSYHELVMYCLTNRISSGNYAQVYDSQITKFMSQRF